MKFIFGEMKGLVLSKGPWHQTCIENVMNENFPKGSSMHFVVHPRHTLAERVILHLIVILSWPFEKLCVFLRDCAKKMHDIDLGSVDF
jgi:hypothetical protein